MNKTEFHIQISKKMEVLQHKQNKPELGFRVLQTITISSAWTPLKTTMERFLF